jgi:hypothetical protein
MGKSQRALEEMEGSVNRRIATPAHPAARVGPYQQHQGVSGQVEWGEVLRSLKKGVG